MPTHGRKDRGSSASCFDPSYQLRHRIRTTFHADAKGITTDDIVKKLIETVPAPL